jgi:hypothetical protein
MAAGLRRDIRAKKRQTFELASKLVESGSDVISLSNQLNFCSQELWHLQVNLNAIMNRGDDVKILKAVQKRLAKAPKRMDWPLRTTCLRCQHRAHGSTACEVMVTTSVEGRTFSEPCGCQ